MRAVLRTVLALGLMTLFSATALADKRVALVVANGAYKGAALANPTVDADLIATSLINIGFSVKVVRDADLGGFDAALNAFGAEAKGADVALFYFAGHGFAVNDGLKPQSLLMSTSADVTASSERVLRAGGIPLDDVVRTLAGQADSTLIFIDACRNDPRVSRALGGTGRGLSRLDATKSRGLLIGLSTRLGDTAEDGEAGKGSPFARAFAANIQTKGLRIDDVFRRLRDAVRAETDGREVPDIVQDDLPDGAFILAKVQPAAPTSVAAPAEAPVKPVPAAPAPVQEAPVAPTALALFAPAINPPVSDPKAQELALKLDLGEGAKIQAALDKQGFHIAYAGGTFGEDTRAAIKAWQAKRGDLATGFLTPAQRGALIAYFRQQGPRAFPQAIPLSVEDLGDNPDPRLVKAVKTFAGEPVRYGFVGDKLFIAVQHWSIDWASAESRAEAAGGTLATFSSAAENAFAYDLFARDSRFVRINDEGGKNGPWIGLVRDKSAAPPSGGWHWVDGGKVGYRKWAEGQPNFREGRDNCGRFYSHGRVSPKSEQRPLVWDDSPCEWTSDGFVMQIVGNRDAAAAPKN